MNAAQLMVFQAVGRAIGVIAGCWRRMQGQVMTDRNRPITRSRLAYAFIMATPAPQPISFLRIRSFRNFPQDWVRDTGSSIELKGIGGLEGQ